MHDFSFFSKTLQHIIGNTQKSARLSFFIKEALGITLLLSYFFIPSTGSYYNLFLFFLLCALLLYVYAKNQYHLQQQKNLFDQSFWGWQHHMENMLCHTKYPIKETIAQRVQEELPIFQKHSATIYSYVQSEVFLLRIQLLFGALLLSLFFIVHPMLGVAISGTCALTIWLTTQAQIAQYQKSASHQRGQEKFLEHLRYFLSSNVSGKHAKNTLLAFFLRTMHHFLQYTSSHQSAFYVYFNATPALLLLGVCFLMLYSNVPASAMLLVIFFTPKVLYASILLSKALHVEKNLTPAFSYLQKLCEQIGQNAPPAPIQEANDTPFLCHKASDGTPFFLNKAPDSSALLSLESFNPLILSHLHSHLFYTPPLDLSPQIQRIEGFGLYFCIYPAQTGHTTWHYPLEAHIERGQICALVGPTGSGKSQLIKACATLLPIQSPSHIRLAQSAPSHLTDLQKQLHFSYIGQTTPFVDQFVIQKIKTFLALEPGMPHIGWILQFLTLLQQKKVSQSGISTTEPLPQNPQEPYLLLDHGAIQWALNAKNLNTLGVSEQKLLMIICSVPLEPKIILWDAPETFLDGLQMQLLEKILTWCSRQGASALIATQSKTLLNLSTRTLLMHQGRFIKDAATH